MSSLSSYLASKYLSADPAPTKTKKRKRTKNTEDGLIIADDTLDFIPTTAANDDEDGPLVTNSRSAEFRKSKKSAWKVVGVPAPSTDEQRAADRIIEAAAAENAQAAAEDGPEVVKMSDGTHAGLQSGAAVAAQMAAAASAEKGRWEAEERALKRSGKAGEQETVFRDATGRRIDISMRRAEARREEEERARKERKEKEEMGGEAQMKAKEKRKEELDEARFMPVARTIDDEKLNDELKSQIRWNDPAMQFLSTKKATGESKSKNAGAAAGPRKPTYNGSAPPNRYGIRPGYRWDGVDRGNGWEAERFKQANRLQRNKQLDFAWQEDT